MGVIHYETRIICCTLHTIIYTLQSVAICKITKSPDQFLYHTCKYVSSSLSITYPTAYPCRNISSRLFTLEVSTDRTDVMKAAYELNITTAKSRAHITVIRPDVVFGAHMLPGKRKLWKMPKESHATSIYLLKSNVEDFRG